MSPTPPIRIGTRQSRKEMLRLALRDSLWMSVAVAFVGIGIAYLFGRRITRTLKEVVERISKEVKTILADKEVQDKLLNAGAIANFQGPAQMAQRVSGDYAKWGQVIRDKGITFE